jgi:hypothetical protein
VLAPQNHVFVSDFITFPTPSGNTKNTYGTLCRPLPCVTLPSLGPQIRNDSWTFESIRATVCVGGLAQAPTDANPDEDSNGSPGDVEGEGEGGVRDTNPPIVVQQGEDDAGEGSGASGDTLRGVGGKWGYEVRLVTSGILQIGWASADCLFEPEKGGALHSRGKDAIRTRVGVVCNCRHPCGHTFMYCGCFQ